MPSPSRARLEPPTLTLRAPDLNLTMGAPVAFTCDLPVAFAIFVWPFLKWHAVQRQKPGCIWLHLFEILFLSTNDVLVCHKTTPDFEQHPTSQMCCALFLSALVIVERSLSCGLSSPFPKAIPLTS
eukprot:Hpha_TRINITY_DN27248_c0_g1::TRINITY_DN27248_c0_g1_i1::g.140818::m.140818